MDDFIPAYVEALCDEIRIVSNSVDNKIAIHTIFFGGGTPSLLSISQFETLVKTLETNFNVTSEPEISVEVNPGTISIGYLKGLVGLGFNRLSLGAQSLNDNELNLLGRIHTREEIFDGVKAAREAGFRNINLDMIFGLPDQKMRTWKNNLNDAISISPEHLSLYCLSIEKATNFGNWVERGMVKEPDPDLAADMYEWAGMELICHDYLQYEISNWSRTNYECRHNLQYWRNNEYLGFGAGAHGFIDGLRIANTVQIKKYINRIKETDTNRKIEETLDFPIAPATISQVVVDRFTEMQDTLMLGLRLTREGVSSRKYFEKFGENMTDVFKKEISELLNSNLVEWRGDTLRIKQHARILGNQVFMKFVN
jgi:oxygen-independent coproporphyrinogen-3 oxidase